MQLLETKTGYYADYTEEIKRGAILLDAFAPGWERNINQEILDLSSGNQCVLGQVVVQNHIVRDNVRLNGWDEDKLDYGALTEAFERLSQPEEGEEDDMNELMWQVEAEAEEEYNPGHYGFVAEPEWALDQAELICESFCTLVREQDGSIFGNVTYKHVNQGPWGCPREWVCEHNLYESLSEQWLDFIYNRLVAQEQAELERRWEMAELYMEAEWEDLQRTLAKSRELAESNLRYLDAQTPVPV